MTKTAQDILRKISYIEAEIEIQKQILYSIPTAEREEMERVLTTIAAAKEDIELLRSEIEKIDPDEFQRLTRIEESVTAFKKISSEKKFCLVESMTFDKECILTCLDGRKIKCLVKACDEKGDWTIISIDGRLTTLPGNEVLNN